MRLSTNNSYDLATFTDTEPYFFPSINYILRVVVALLSIMQVYVHSISSDLGSLGSLFR